MEEPLRTQQPRVKRRPKSLMPALLNPITEQRNELGLSHEVFANKVGCTKQAIIRLEQGCYEQILPAVLLFLVNDIGCNELSLVDAYEGFREDTRKQHYRYFGDFAPDTFSTLLHPFICLRHNVNASTTKVAKDLCLSQATLSHWEKHWKTQQSVPKSFVNCLKEIGYNDFEIHSLRKAYKEFRLARKR